MARMSVYESSSEEDEFPDLNTLVQRVNRKREDGQDLKRSDKAVEKSVNKIPAVRRRKLGQLSDSLLLKPWAGSTPPTTGPLAGPASRTTVQLRARKQVPPVRITPLQDEREEEAANTSEEETFVEEVTVDDSSDFYDALSSHSADEDYTSDPVSLPKSSTQPSRRLQAPSWSETAPPDVAHHSKRTAAIPVDDGQPKSTEGPSTRKPMPRKGIQKKGPGAEPSRKLDDDMADMLYRMDINEPDLRNISPVRKASNGRPRTPPPPSTPPKARPMGLVSPTKVSRIPTTPHHPNSDLFWSREFVDDWNDEHSPKKQLFPNPSRSPAKTAASPKKKASTSKPVSDREAKKAFEQAKHDIAAQFLRELDKTITQGRISELAESTGGVKLVWTNKLNTTAGRANWKRETVRSTKVDGTKVVVRQNHHASIELAEKVIDNEHRLLNVLAHEFCHLANFMVSGITNNPHGKEFKVWAAKCSREFGSRGIEVTTKHSYDIDFKYIWECAACATEYKRHSRSIDPKRHRCGNPSCKGELKQIKPTPRAGSGKASEYQVFMKEQMKIIKEENPKSPQKDIMKLVADRWSSRQNSSKTVGKDEGGVASVASALIDLTLGGA